MVSVFQLTKAGEEKFMSASYEELFENSQKALGDGMVGSPTTKKVRPSSTESITINKEPSAVAFGVAGWFRNPDGHSWKKTIATSSLSQKPGEHIEVLFGDRSLSLNRDREIATRGVKTVAAKRANLAPSRFRIKGEGERRTPDNSVQFEVRVNQASYITIYDVDQEGGVNVLFPAACQASNFYKDGSIPAKTWVRIPDSLQSPNRLGCYFDFTNPPGTDTVQVMAHESREEAVHFRELLERGTIEENSNPKSLKGNKATPTTLVQVREDIKTRGIKAVADRAPTAARHDLSPSNVVQKMDPTRASNDTPPMESDWNTATIRLEVRED
jgi:type VI secretion system VasD/TssJ family lipoprotein